LNRIRKEVFKMPINFSQPLTTQNNNVNNILRRVEVNNTYSLQNTTIGAKEPSQNKETNNTVNTNQNNTARIESNENNKPLVNLRNVYREKNLQNEVNELASSVNVTEKNQIENIENLNANIAQGIKPAGTGTRLVNNFFSNAGSNLGGKVDTLA